MFVTPPEPPYPASPAPPLGALPLKSPPFSPAPYGPAAPPPPPASPVPPLYRIVPMLADAAPPAPPGWLPSFAPSVSANPPWALTLALESDVPLNQVLPPFCPAGFPPAPPAPTESDTVLPGVSERFETIAYAPPPPPALPVPALLFPTTLPPPPPPPITSTVLFAGFQSLGTVHDVPEVMNITVGGRSSASAFGVPDVRLTVATRLRVVMKERTFLNIGRIAKR